MLGKILLLLTGICVIACEGSGSFTREEEKRVGILDGAGIMSLFMIDHEPDSIFLRQYAKDLTAGDLATETFRILKTRMLATVNDTTNQGVGIAAPQVGISRQLVAIQRLDKAGEPFEFYVNPNIIHYSKDSVLGREGCLSVPDRLDSLWRSREIIIRYRDENTFEWKQDTVAGFTARIFQHEMDHLRGILFTDHVK